MSVKDIKNYYDSVANQYLEMVNDLKDFEEAVSNNIIEPERLEQIKKNIEPIKANYQRLSYIMYLLNLPVKKNKHKKYEQQNKKFLKMIGKENTQEAVKQENENTLNMIKDEIDK